MSRKRLYQIDEIHPSINYGNFKIIEIVGFIYETKFINSGYTCRVNSSQIKSGFIKDKMISNTITHGFIGNWKKKEFPKYHFLYERWRRMLDRCYNVKSKDYISYGKKGIIVEEFLWSFSNYVEFIELLPNYNDLVAHPSKWDIDKDYLSSFNNLSKIYSRDTIKILKKEENKSNLRV